MNDDLRRAALASTDPKWAKELQDSRVVEGVDGLEVAVESDIETQKPRTEEPEPEASRVGAADAPTPSDGRNRRRARSSADILQAARAYLLEGNYRPSMSEICDRAGYSLRTGFQHFGTLENLLLTVLDMNGMAETIAVVAVSGTPIEIARRLVRGR